MQKLSYIWQHKVLISVCLFGFLSIPYMCPYILERIHGSSYCQPQAKANAKSIPGRPYIRTK